jgi:hypothetical protein
MSTKQEKENYIVELALFYEISCKGRGGVLFFEIFLFVDFLLRVIFVHLALLDWVQLRLISNVF